MDKKWAMKWVKALRSGKYKKGTGRLKNKDRYCCLGVLCDISKVDKWDEEDRYLSYGASLPVVVRDLVKMKSDIGTFLSTHLVEYNDAIAPQKKKGFKYIADIIEKHWKDL